MKLSRVVCPSRDIAPPRVVASSSANLPREGEFHFSDSSVESDARSESKVLSGTLPRASTPTAYTLAIGVSHQPIERVVRKLRPNA
jgi:hypothetical protein